MRNKLAIPAICIRCKWYNFLGCMYEGELREDFKPGIKCFKPLDDPSYPNPRKIVKQFFEIFYKSFSKLEYEFVTENGEYKDGSKFLSVLLDNIRLLEQFKNKFLTLQKEFRKYSKICDNEIRYLN